MSGIGPVQALAVGFGPQAQFEGRVLEELERLRDQGVITADDFEAKKKQLLGI